MKTVQSFFLHPFTIIFLFMFLIISGESNAAFYCKLLLMGLPYGVLHAIIGTAGICLLIAASIIRKTPTANFLNIAGSFCMFISLLLFFTQPGSSYNYNTFREAVPISILVCFFLLLTLFFIKHLQPLLRSKRKPPVAVV